MITQKEIQGKSIGQMIECKQKQWTSGKSKDKYCQDCKDKKRCFKVLGR